MSRLNAIGAVAACVLAAACTAPVVAPTASPAPITPAAPTSAPSTTVPATPEPQTPAPEPSATPSPIETAPATAFPEGSVIVTFAVEAEEFRILLTDPVDVANAVALLAGEEVPTIPNGLIVYGDPGVNAPWTWQIDPASLEFADVTVEVCDGLPSHVEGRILTSDRYCPWSAEVISIEPAGE